eukprot:402659_1
MSTDNETTTCNVCEKNVPFVTQCDNCKSMVCGNDMSKGNKMENVCLTCIVNNPHLKPRKARRKLTPTAEKNKIDRENEEDKKTNTKNLFTCLNPEMKGNPLYVVDKKKLALKLQRAKIPRYVVTLSTYASLKSTWYRLQKKMESNKTANMQIEVFGKLLSKNSKPISLTKLLGKILILRGPHIVKPTYSTAIYRKSNILGQPLDDCYWIQTKQTDEDKQKVVETVMKLLTGNVMMLRESYRECSTLLRNDAHSHYFDFREKGNNFYEKCKVDVDYTLNAEELVDEILEVIKTTMKSCFIAGMDFEVKKKKKSTKNDWKKQMMLQAQQKRECVYNTILQIPKARAAFLKQQTKLKKKKRKRKANKNDNNSKHENDDEKNAEKDDGEKEGEIVDMNNLEDFGSKEIEVVENVNKNENNTDVMMNNNDGI